MEPRHERIARIALAAGARYCRPVPPWMTPYELHLPSDGVTIWYVVAPYRGQEIISIQLVRLDT
jgi:hypothetical protein